MFFAPFSRGSFELSYLAQGPFVRALIVFLWVLSNDLGFFVLTHSSGYRNCALKQ